LFIYSLFTKNGKRKKAAVIFSLVTLYLFSNPFLFDEVMRRWEIPAKQYSELGVYDAGIVLGGMVKYDPQYDRAQFARGVDRLIQAIDLYKRGVIRKIYFAGGSGEMMQPELGKEGPLVKKYLLRIGIPEGDMIIETESRNTHQNAEFAKPLLDSIVPGGKYLLITSGFHMRRASACFIKEGIVTTPFSTDRHSGPRKFYPDHLLIPDAEAMAAWDNLIREISGYYIYKLIGYL
jgi:uncharacterized SAM-binding protein YcdF (DUF218 family)